LQDSRALVSLNKQYEEYQAQQHQIYSLILKGKLMDFFKKIKYPAFLINLSGSSTLGYNVNLILSNTKIGFKGMSLDFHK